MNTLVMRTLRFLSFVLLLQTFTGPVSADPITVGFSGVMTHIEDPGGVLDPSIAEASFSGSYTIDPALLSGEPRPTIPGARLYPLLPGGGSLNVSVGGIPFALAIPDIFIGDGGGGCPNPCDIWTHTVSGPTGAIVPAIFFVDTSATKLSSTDFFVNQELTGWEGIVQLVELFEDGAVFERRAVGVIRTIGVIPEPASALLLAAGLLVLAGGGAWRARRARNQGQTPFLPAAGRPDR